MTTATLAPPSTKIYENKQWKLSNGVWVKAHRYDDKLFAFEVTQQKTCLGTIIPESESHMKSLLLLFEKDLTINGIECNDGFGTVIKIKRF